jgi:hypothetical protein
VVLELHLEVSAELRLGKKKNWKASSMMVVAEEASSRWEVLVLEV